MNDFPILYKTKQYLSVASSMVLDVGLPAPCPALLSILMSTGFNLADLGKTRIGVRLQQARILVSGEKSGHQQRRQDEPGQLDLAQ